MLVSLGLCLPSATISDVSLFGHVGYNKYIYHIARTYNETDTQKLSSVQNFPTNYSMPTIRNTCCTNFIAIRLPDNKLNKDRPT